MSIPDKAVEALHEQVVTQFRRHGQYSLADAREALEAAEPYLTGNVGDSGLRAALVTLAAEWRERETGWDEYCEIVTLLAAHPEVKS